MRVGHAKIHVAGRLGALAILGEGYWCRLLAQPEHPKDPAGGAICGILPLNWCAPRDLNPEPAD